MEKDPKPIIDSWLAAQKFGGAQRIAKRRGLQDYLAERAISYARGAILDLGEHAKSQEKDAAYILADASLRTSDFLSDVYHFVRQHSADQDLSGFRQDLREYFSTFPNNIVLAHVEEDEGNYPAARDAMEIEAKKNPTFWPRVGDLEHCIGNEDRARYIWSRCEEEYARRGSFERALSMAKKLGDQEKILEYEKLVK